MFRRHSREDTLIKKLYKSIRLFIFIITAGFLFTLVNPIEAEARTFTAPSDAENPGDYDHWVTIHFTWATWDNKSPEGISLAYYYDRDNGHGAKVGQPNYYKDNMNLGGFYGTWVKDRKGNEWWNQGFDVGYVMESQSKGGTKTNFVSSHDKIVIHGDMVGLTPVLFLPLSIEAPTGYEFTGWSVSGSSPCASPVYGISVYEVALYQSDVWVTANYRAISTVARLNANGGTIINEQNQAQLNNFELTFIGLRPTYRETYFRDMKLRATRTGYNFAGWYNDPSGGEMVWDTNGYAVQDNGSCNYWAGGGSRKWNELKWNLYSDWENMRWNYSIPNQQLYFYAHWNPHHYFMVSDVNTPAEAHTAATGGWNPVITTYDDANYGTAALASCPGYTFLGWFTDPTGGEMIYNAQGQRCINNSIFDNRGAWRWDEEGNGATLTLYAHWSNNPPANEWFKATELGTNNVWWANINNDNPANQGAITDTAKWSNKGYNFRLRGNDIGDGIRFAGILNENDCWLTTWDGNVIAGEWTKDITDDGIYSQVYGHVKDSAGQWRNTGAFKVYIDRQAPKINTFNVKIGAQKNLMPDSDRTAIASHPAVGNIYKDYESTPYGSWVSVSISDANNNIKAVRGGSGAVSGINTVQVKVYDIKNPSHNKVYTLAQNTGINYEYSGILDTISDFPEVMELGYELIVTDYAGNTSTSGAKSTSRGIEVYSSIEKVDTDINGDSSFVCGTRGIVHVFTTGWVDNVSVQFPDSFNKAWAYDEARGVPKPSLTPINYRTYGRNDFIRCWDIEFWIPMSLINPDNPDHITPDPNGSINWPINVIGHDEYPYINVNLPGGTPGHGGSTPDATISVPSIPGNNKSILDQFRTIIKQDN